MAGMNWEIWQSPPAVDGGLVLMLAENGAAAFI